MSTALTGTSADLGLSFSSGFRTALGEVNASGGIHGRKVELLLLDDGYEPSHVAANIQKLIDDGVIAIAGNVGTPTAVVTANLCDGADMLFFAPFTGANFLRAAPYSSHIFHIRASYQEEMAELAKLLVDEMQIRPNRIGLITQRDAFGDAGFNAVVGALSAYGVSNPSTIVHGRFARNSLNVQNAVAEILLADPPVEAVIFVGTAAPGAKAIQLLRQHRYRGRFATISFVNVLKLAEFAGSDAEGVISSMVVPLPSTDDPLAVAFREAASQFGPADARPDVRSPVALEGYAAAKSLIRLLRECGPRISRSELLSHTRRESGLGVYFALEGRTSNEGVDLSRRVWRAMVRGQALVEISNESHAGESK